MIELWGKYQGQKAEIIDTCGEGELSYLLGEYRLAYGQGWQFWTKKVKGEINKIKEIP